MPNIAAVLKAEFVRLARKHARAEAEGLKKVVSSQRAELVALKRQVHGLERLVEQLGRAAGAGQARSKAIGSAGEQGAQVDGLRFSSKGMASNRKRLGLSAADFGLLVGASGQSVYAWEAGTSKPRAKNLAAISALRGMGKKQVEAKLEALKQVD